MASNDDLDKYIKGLKEATTHLQKSMKMGKDFTSELLKSSERIQAVVLALQEGSIESVKKARDVIDAINDGVDDAKFLKILQKSTKSADQALAIQKKITDQYESQVESHKQINKHQKGSLNYQEGLLKTYETESDYLNQIDKFYKNHHKDLKSIASQKMQSDKSSMNGVEAQLGAWSRLTKAQGEFMTNLSGQSISKAMTGMVKDLDSLKHSLSETIQSGGLSPDKFSSTILDPIESKVEDLISLQSELSSTLQDLQSELSTSIKEKASSILGDSSRWGEISEMQKQSAIQLADIVQLEQERPLNAMQMIKKASAIDKLQNDQLVAAILMLGEEENRLQVTAQQVELHQDLINRQKVELQGMKQVLAVQNQITTSLDKSQQGWEKFTSYFPEFLGMTKGVTSAFEGMRKLVAQSSKDQLTGWKKWATIGRGSISGMGGMLAGLFNPVTLGLVATLGVVILLKKAVTFLVDNMHKWADQARSISLDFGLTADKAWELQRATLAYMASGRNVLLTQEEILEIQKKQKHFSGVTYDMNSQGTEKLMTQIKLVSDAYGASIDDVMELMQTVEQFGADPSTAKGLTAAVYQAAKLTNMSPTMLGKDIVDNANVLANHFSGMPAAMVKTVAQVNKLGFNIKQISGLMDKTLDVEQFQRDVFELYAMTGQDFSSLLQISTDATLSSGERMTKMAEEAGKLLNDSANAGLDGLQKEMMARKIESMTGISQLEQEKIRILQSVRGKVDEGVYNTLMDHLGEIGDISNASEAEMNKMAKNITASQNMKAKWAEVSSKLNEIWIDVAEKFGKLWTELSDSGVIDELIGLIKKFAGGMASVVPDLLSGLKDKLKWLSDDTQGSLSSKLMTILTDVFEVGAKFIGAGISAALGKATGNKFGDKDAVEKLKMELSTGIKAPEKEKGAVASLLTGLGGYIAVANTWAENLGKTVHGKPTKDLGKVWNDVTGQDRNNAQSQEAWDKWQAGDRSTNTKLPNTTRASVPQASPDIVSFLKRHEGFRANAYGDYKQTSIGYGTRAQPGETSITKEEAEKRLQHRVMSDQVKILEAAAKKGIAIQQNQLDSLTSFSYNVGSSKGPEMIRRFGDDWEAMADTMAKYVKAGGEVHPTLVKRRQEEISMLLGPKTPMEQLQPQAEQFAFNRPTRATKSQGHAASISLGPDKSSTGQNVDVSETAISNSAAIFSQKQSGPEILLAQVNNQLKQLNTNVVGLASRPVEVTISTDPIIKATKMKANNNG